MTRRVPSNGASFITWWQYFSAPLMEVQDSEARGASARRSAQVSASCWLAMRVQGRTVRWYSAPAHST